MTHTTTDAAEARADTFRGDNEALIASIDALLSLDDAKALVPRPLGGAGSHAYRLLCAARHRLATAEAASGAGEREVVEEAVPSPVDDAEAQAFIAGWNATRSGTDFDMALHRWMLSSVRPAASLPPATDPAIPNGWKLVSVEQIEAADDAWQGLKQTQLAASAVGVEIAQSLREGYGLHLTLALRALAAAPTIPATGEAVPVIDAKLLGEVMQDAWGEICDDAGAHPLDMKHGRGSVLFYSPGHWTDLIALRLNERLPATGHAATEGEGA